MDDEVQVIVENGKWAEYEADSPQDAAADLAQEMAESGDYPDHMSGGFDIHVRDLETSKLYAVNIGFDWDPIAYASETKEVPPEKDLLVQGTASYFESGT